MDSREPLSLSVVSAVGSRHTDGRNHHAQHNSAHQRRRVRTRLGRSARVAHRCRSPDGNFRAACSERTPHARLGHAHTRRRHRRRPLGQRQLLPSEGRQLRSPQPGLNHERPIPAPDRRRQGRHVPRGRQLDRRSRSQRSQPARRQPGQHRTGSCYRNQRPEAHGLLEIRRTLRARRENVRQQQARHSAPSPRPLRPNRPRRHDPRRRRSPQTRHRSNN